MSEYQYYEFQTLDRPLTLEEQQEIGSLSRRVQLSSNQAIFTYSYGDFRGRPEEVLAQYFDAMLYMANWGSTQLMLRLPKALVDMAQIQPYCINDKVSCTVEAEYVILNITSCQEEGRGWFEGEGWLTLLTPLRDALLKKDYRLLYLAWLMAIMESYEDELEEWLKEPPVPCGLCQLSEPLHTFIDLFDLDSCLLDVASQTSQKMPEAADVNFDNAIAKLSRETCNDFLNRLLQGETNLAIALHRMLQALPGQNQNPFPVHTQAPRTAQALLEAARQEWQREQARRTQAAAEQHRQKMEKLAREAPQSWRKVIDRIECKNVKAYEEAITIMLALKELAAYQKRTDEFQAHITQLHDTYSRLSGLRARMTHAGLGHSV